MRDFFGEIFREHHSRHRIHRRFTNPNGKPRLCRNANALACNQADAGPEEEASHAGLDLCLVGYIRIIASVLDDTGKGAIFGQPVLADPDRQEDADWQAHRHILLRFPGKQMAQRRLAAAVAAVPVLKPIRSLSLTFAMNSPWDRCRSHAVAARPSHLMIR